VVLHIVLFRPKPNVNDADRRAMFDALHTASTRIPSVRHFHVGKRVLHGAGYEMLMSADYPYAAVIAFDDLEGLQRYLEHPHHEELARLFYALLDAAMIYDYEASSPSADGFAHETRSR
jgi:Stress responsive A/B Barrel Domain